MKFKRRNLTLLTLGLAITLTTGCAAGLEKSFQESVQKNIDLPGQDTEISKDQKKLKKAPDIEFMDYNGNVVKLSDFKGKYLMVNSWATWCPFCKKELVDFANSQKKFGDKVVVIVINRGESDDKAQAYANNLGVRDDLIFWADKDDEFYKSINGFSMPETLFVDKEGFIRFHKRGVMDQNETDQRIEQLIQLN